MSDSFNLKSKCLAARESLHFAQTSVLFQFLPSWVSAGIGSFVSITQVESFGHTLVRLTLAEGG